MQQYVLFVLHVIFYFVLLTFMSTLMQKCCFCLTAGMSVSPPPFQNVDKALPSFFADIVKLIGSIARRLKYTFGYRGDKTMAKSATHNGKPPTYQNAKRRLLPNGKPLEPCVKRCSQNQTGYFTLCGSCAKFVMCYKGYVSLILIGWCHVYDANVN